MGRISRRSRDCRSVEDYEAVMSPLYAYLARLAESAPPERLQRGGRVSRTLWTKLNPPDGGGDLTRFMLGRIGIPCGVAAITRASCSAASRFRARWPLSTSPGWGP